MKKRILALALCLALVLGMAVPVYAEGTPPALDSVEVTAEPDVPAQEPGEPSPEPPSESSPEPSPAPSPTPVEPSPEPSPAPSEEPGEPSPEPSEEPAVTESPAPAEEPADLAPPIEGTLEEGDSGVTVRVAAPEGAFPAGTELFITPVSTVATMDMDGERNAMDGIEASVADALAEEPRGSAAFDISFLYDGEVLQPNEGYQVSVIFEVATDSNLLAEADRLQVFHMQETEESGTLVAQPVTEAIPVDPEAELQILEVAAERFSIYVVSGIASAKPTLSLKIGDKIAINGCLVPEVVNLPSPNPIVSYRWTRLDGTVIKEEALSSGHAVTNGVNVAVDRGGVDDTGRAVKTYTVEALDENGKLLASASFDVPYGNEVINGSFEQPESKGVSFFQNGTANLFWRTTANDGQIEIGRPGLSDATQQYNTDTAAEGKQFAELNANNAGTLYQDVLTTPGANLNWLLSHRGRGEPNKGSQPNKTDTMYVIIAAAGSASKIKTQDDVKKLIPAAVANGKTYTETITTDGKETVTITYTIWELKHNNCNWYSAGDAYQVPAGQYLTRFFFAAGPTAYAGSQTVGNLIDHIYFSEKLPYEIQYYKDGMLEDTERDLVAPGTTVTATPPNGFSDLVLDHAMLNGSAYTGGADIKVVAGPYVLKLYYVSTGITVTKKVEGLAKDLTQDQLQVLLNGYQAVFTLKAGGEDVATATVGVNVDTQTGTAVFTTSSGEKFVPHKETDYTVVETSCSTIDGYGYSGTTINGAASTSYTFNTGDSQAATVAAINTYVELPKSRNLTIMKTITENQNPEQSFIFKVTGHQFEMQVVLEPEDFNQGTASVTIQNLPGGEYSVTEDAAWSWKYSCDNASQSVTIAGNPETVSFTNARNASNWFGATDKAENVFNAVTSTQRSMEPAALPIATESEDDEEV